MEVTAGELLRQPDRSLQASMLESFFLSVESAEESCLLLDFDGTLAPFRVDPSRAHPWAGVAKLLDAIERTGRTRMAIVTGRPSQDVAALLGMRSIPEIWGLHGAERLYPDGRVDREVLRPDAISALDAARAAVHAERLGVRIEEKWNAVVLHWRGLPPRVREATEAQALSLLCPFEDQADLRLLQFDGGIELRAGPDKGDAVRGVLKEIPPTAPVAYLGDDTTDEHAFLALSGRGLSVLVRRAWRPGAAQVWLRPPAELRGFLEAWLRATRA
jgi:trehalose 6-phosphate phosphatase